jgi:thiol-disulfide isomerase/thioredoxin
MIRRRTGIPVVYLCIFLWSQGAAAAGPDAGRELDLAGYRGQVVVVHFWASWSEPCRRSLPWLIAMQNRYADEGLVVLGVNEDDDGSAALAFLTEFSVNFTTVRDADAELFETWDIIAMPSSYVIDRQGRIVERYLGFKTALVGDYEAALRDALARR